MEKQIQLCTFRLGKLLLGIDVLSVQEVIKCPALTPVPLAPSEIEGLLNLRGQILTAIDLRRQFSLPEDAGANDGAKMLIIVRTRKVEAALIVDSVGDVIDVSDETFEQAAVNVPASVRPYIVGVHKLEKRLLHVLDAEATASISSSPTL
ncbi:chemotaxis protein CheW [Pelagicoccus sp. SDUM812002]|uniref:chemotaxis protein CheW n=1 Tax=Pelagicoccus sp. SDUM812002 TaxID=3041266 RepID=UPI00280D9168|nr:chemotaxis protein CheW [Pelagicoccus sp. SDUM812002]MDQ8184783.1 chemotaxis protein CheW [Pelagicoccus sp. SDUM812002]